MSFGEELRRERELRQISLREIALATKIDLRRLEELERNDFSGLPGGLYNRGFIRAYCKHIGVDAEAMVNAYLLEERTQVSSPLDTAQGAGLLRGGGTLKTVAAEEAAFAEQQAAAGRTRIVRRLLVLTLAALLLAAGAFLAWRMLGPAPGGEAPAQNGSSAAGDPRGDVR